MVMALKSYLCLWKCSPNIPKWIGPFLVLFIVNAFLMGSTKVFGLFFRELSSQPGLNGSLSGFIFVIPSAVSHIMSPLVGRLCTRFSCRHLGTFGGFLVGSNFILIGLYSTNWMHFLLFAIGAGTGFGFLFFPTVLSLHSRAGDSISILMPLASIGSFFGVFVLPVIGEIFLRQYGLRAALYLFGALTWHTIPCSLLLENKPVRGSETKCIDENINRDDVQHDGRNIKSIKDEGIVAIVFNFLRTVGKQFRMFSYTIFVLIFIAANSRRFVSDTWTIFLIPHNVEMGLEKTNAIEVASFGGIGGMIGRLFAAIAFTKTGLFALEALTAYYLLGGISFVAYELRANVFYFCLCGFFNGVFLSAQSGMIVGIISELFQPSDFRDAFGLIDFGCGAFSLVSGYIAGGIYDLTGSFRMLFLLSALVSVMNATLIGIVIILRKLSSNRTKGNTEGV